MATKRRKGIDLEKQRLRKRLYQRIRGKTSKWRAYNLPYQRIWARNRRDAFFAGKKCTFCGSTHSLVLFNRAKLIKKFGLNQTSSNLFTQAKQVYERVLVEAVISCRSCQNSALNQPDRIPLSVEERDRRRKEERRRTSNNWRARNKKKVLEMNRRSNAKKKELRRIRKLPRQQREEMLKDLAKKRGIIT